MPALKKPYTRTPGPPSRVDDDVKAQAQRDTLADLERAAECEALALAEPHREDHWKAEARAARGRIVARFDPMCQRLAREFAESRSGRVAERDDLLQEARDALWRAVFVYDPQRPAADGLPVKFHTLAHRVVVNQIRQYVGKAYKQGFTWMPRNSIAPIVRVMAGEKWAGELVVDHLADPVDEERLVDMLTAPPEANGRGWDEAYWRQMFARAHLSEKEVACVRLRYLGNNTLEQCGLVLGVSKERCRQLIVSATKKLAEVVA